MARGGRRTYVRDSRGRFASTPGGGAQAKGGTLGARSSLKKSRSKLASKDSADQSLRGTLSRRSQKGAVTRGSKALKEAKASSRARLAVGRPGVIGKRKVAKVAAGIKAKAQVKTFNARPSKPKTEKQRAKSLLSVNKKAWIKEEIKAIESKAGKRFTPKQKQKEERRISTAINKLAPSDQIRGAKRAVQLTKQERQKEASLNKRYAQGARGLKQANKELEARFTRRQRAQSKADEFTRNAKAIAADKTKPLNTRKLANAVAKGIRRSSVTGGKLNWVKTDRTEPSGWDRVRGEKGIMYSMRKLRQAREAREAATDGLKQGRGWVIKGNKKPFAKKKRVPKPIIKGLPRSANTIKGRDLESKYTPYQRLLRQQSRKTIRGFSKIKQQKPPAVKKKTPMRRPATPR